MNPDTALLGAILSGYDLDGIAEFIHPGDFREPRNELLYAAILKVHESGTRVDPVTVRGALTAETLRMLPGGPAHLVTLASECPNPLEAPEYARQVRDSKQRRDLENVAVTLHDELRNLDRDPAEIGERAAGLIGEAVSERGAVDAPTLGDVMPDVIDVAEHGQPLALSTPWPDIDRLITGLVPGRLITVGARPGVGKSVMGTNLALHTAHKHKHGVIFCSIEMPAVEVGQRILAAHAKVSLSALEHGNVPPTGWNLIAEKSSEISEMPIRIHDAAMQTVSSIRAAVKHAQKRRTVALVVVDYLQLLSARDPKQHREAQVSEMARGLKLLARETNTCVVAMAQVNRASTLRSGGRPTLADLRESGEIEAASDVVILLHRPEEHGTDILADVAKQRSGPTGEVNLQLQGHYARLVPSVSNWREQVS